MKRATLLHLLLGSIASAVMLAVWFFRAPELIFSTSVVLTALLFLLAIQVFTRPSSRASAFNYFLATVLMVTMVTVNNEAYVRNNLPHEPFIGIKAIAILVAIVCPPIPWAAWASLALAGVIPMIMYYLWDAPTRHTLGIQEPWVTLLFVIMAGFVYYHRFLLLKIRDLLVEWRVKSRLQKKMTHLLVSCQHIMNSPFQSIEILMAMMNKREPGNKVLFEKSKIHFDQIRKVNEVLTILNNSFDWQRAPLSKNPEELENLIQSLIEELKKPNCPVRV